MRPTGNRRAARKDQNDDALARVARALGWEIIHQPPGCGCDWIALLPDGRVELIEIKNPLQPPSARRMTEQESALFAACVLRNIPYRIVETEQQLKRIHDGGKHGT